jgi:hypothetical protein
MELSAKFLYGIPFSRLIFILLFAGLSIGVCSVYLPPDVDWSRSYLPALKALLNGQSPYEAGLNNPPWALIPLIPLALVPMKIGRAVLFLSGLISFAYVSFRLGAKPIAVAAFLLSPPVIHDLFFGNINWLPLLGILMPPQIGLFFVTVKPQIGWVVAVLWLVEAWRQGGIRQVLRVFWPISLALTLSFAFFGFWPYRFSAVLGYAQSLNHSLWPTSIPVGLVLLVAALRKRNIRFALAASPCLSPYVLLYAWSGALITLSSMTMEMVAAVAGLWLLVVIRAFSGGL